LLSRRMGNQLTGTGFVPDNDEVIS